MNEQIEGLWEPDGGLNFERIEGKHCRFRIVPRPPYCDRGRWQVYLDWWNHKELHVDSADGWDSPRYFFDLTRCKLEVEAWLKARKEFICQTKNSKK